LKWVVIPAGTRRVEARPTMRLALNKTLTASNLQAAFNRAGISDPESLKREI